MMPRRFYSLDLLRGLAALVVVFWHWQHFFFDGSTFVPYDMQAQPFYALFFFAYQAGWLAVDLFFSLSGFVFFWLYADAVADRRVGAWQFFVLRFSRLYPLHLVSFLLVLVMQHWLLASSGDYFVTPYNDAYHALLNLLLVSGWGLEQGPSFNGPIWSVSLEVLMYLLFFITCRVFGLRLGLNIALVLAGLVLMTVHPILGRGLFSFFLGGLLFQLYRELHRRQWVRPVAPFVIGAAALLWLATLSEVHTPWLLPWLQAQLGSYLPSPLAQQLPAALHGLSRLLVVGLLFPLTILALVLGETLRGHLGRRLASIGDLTYAIYLLHFPLQLALFIAVRQLGIATDIFYEPRALLLFFALLLALCLPTYRYFERPAQDALRKLLLQQPRVQFPIEVKR